MNMFFCLGLERDRHVDIPAMLLIALYLRVVGMLSVDEYVVYLDSTMVIMLRFSKCVIS